MGGGPYYAQLGGSRILNTSRVDQSEADDADVTNWIRTDVIIVAVCIYSGGKDTEAAQYKLRWRDETDDPGGAFADLDSTGECKFGDATALSNGTNLIEANRRTSTQGDSWQNGEEVEGTKLSDSIDLGDNYETEIQFAVSLADATTGLHQYTFDLYDDTRGAQVGVLGAQITLGSTSYKSQTGGQKPFRGTQLNKTHPLARGLVGCWVFNEGSGDRCFNLNAFNNHGTIIGAVWGTGHSGSTLIFDGDADYVTLPSNPVDLSNPHSICCYLYTADHAYTSSGYDQRAINFYDTSTSWVNVGNDSNSTKAIYVSGNFGGTVDNLTSDNVYEQNEWVFVVYTWDGSNIRLYVNGILQSEDGANSNGATAGYKIGARNGVGAPGYWKGGIDTVYAYSQQLSEDKIQWLHREPYAMFEQPSRAKYFYVSVDQDVNVQAALATLTLVANSANINAETDVAASLATLTLAANGADVNAEVDVATVLATLTLAANSADVNAEVDVATILAALTLATKNADVNAEVDVAAALATLTLATNSADINFGVQISAALATLTLAAKNADVNAETDIAAALAQLTLAAQNANINLDANVSANCDTLTLTVNSADVNAEVSIAVNLATLTITSYDVTIETPTGEVKRYNMLLTGVS